MKRLTGGMIVVLGFGLTVSAAAQSKTPTVGHTPYNSNVQPGVKNPAFHSLHLRMRQILEQIQKDLKTNKITQSQASDLRGKVKAVRVQELNWLKESGTKTLTADQITQLNQQLDPIAAAL